MQEEEELFTEIAPAREEPGRFRERHSDVGPRIRFHRLIKQGRTVAIGIGGG